MTSPPPEKPAEIAATATITAMAPIQFNKGASVG